jgi:uncharacterized protein (DUF2062 family)
LLLKEPPERTARTFGFGVFISFSPVIGFHTLFALILLMFVKLNRLAFLAGVFSNTPWTIPASLTLGTAIGVFVLGTDTPLPEMTMETVTSGRFWEDLTSDVSNLLAPYLVGNFILSVVMALLGYALLKWFLLRYQMRKTSDTVAPSEGD